jgi:anaphase-promoting complex subunit 1
MILLLSEKVGGGHELSLQAPWVDVTTVLLPMLNLESFRSLNYHGRDVDRDVRQPKSTTISLEGGNVVAVRNPKQRGVVDVVDSDGRLHQLRIQLQPSTPQVCRVLDVCRSALPYAYGERVLAGWWHAMQWLQLEEIQVADVEWSALVIELFAIFLALGQSAAQPPSKTATSQRKRRTVSSSFGSSPSFIDWGQMQLHEAKNSAAFAPWMLNRGWQWGLSEAAYNVQDNEDDKTLQSRFVPRHIRYARQYMASSFGEAATGESGYLPTAPSAPLAGRRQAACDIFLSLHLLLEEQKLNIMTPEHGPSSSLTLRAVLGQIARWLQWTELAGLYNLGLQEPPDVSFDAGMFS